MQAVRLNSTQLNIDKIRHYTHVYKVYHPHLVLASNMGGKKRVKSAN
jgi:hypothetical protein